jgi:putative Holliday junction resolvase
VRVLCLDLGSKRIGVAISDNDGRVATPIDTVHRSRDRAREHREIEALVQEWEAELLVVGMPYSLDGSRGPAAKNVESEIEELLCTISVPIETYDERLTTVTANRVLMEMDLRADERRKVVDKVAASIILQSWLDAQSSGASDG